MSPQGQIDQSVRVNDLGAGCVGGPELLPDETPYEFDGAAGVLANLQHEKRHHLYHVMNALFSVAGIDTRSGRIPIVVEVGRESNGFSGNDTVLDAKTIFPRIDRLIDVGLSDLRIAGSSGYAYVRTPIEELSRFFGTGKRANLIYLKNVLTNDGLGANIDTPEKLIAILREIYKSLMPRGILSMANFGSTIRPEQLAKVGFDILFDGFVELGFGEGRMFVAQKQ